MALLLHSLAFVMQNFSADLVMHKTREENSELSCKEEVISIYKTEQ
jgi:hypothetical protein